MKNLKALIDMPKESSNFAVIPESVTSDIVTMEDAVNVMREVYREFGTGAAVLSDPPAAFLQGNLEAETLFKVKGGYVPSLNACGFRVVGDVGPDGIRGEHHYCYLLDERTAKPLALVAQTHLHRLRTAACGLVAAETFCTKADPTLALIGAGKIGRQVGEGFSHCFPKGRLLIASRRLESAHGLAETLGKKGHACEAAPSVSAAISVADIVIAITTAEEPVMNAGQFRPGMTIIGMGEHHEFGVDLLNAADKFYTDDLAFAMTLGSVAAWIRRNDTTEVHVRSRHTGGVGAVLAGLTEGRKSEREKMLCVVQGFAIGDMALAEVCRRKAVASSEAMSFAL